jgi:hypothetical protein
MSRKMLAYLTEPHLQTRYCTTYRELTLSAIQDKALGPTLDGQGLQITDNQWSGTKNNTEHSIFGISFLSLAMTIIMS